MKTDRHSVHLRLHFFNDLSNTLIYIWLYLACFCAEVSEDLTISCVIEVSSSLNDKFGKFIFFPI